MSAARIVWRRILRTAICISVRKQAHNFSKITSGTLMMATFYNANLKPIKANDDLKKACDATENSVLDLMVILKKNIMATNKEYREYIQKQIEATLLAASVGPTAKEWDAVTKYRVRADELKEQLNNYEVLLSTLGLLTHDQSSLSYLANNPHKIETLCSTYQELSDLVQSELKENKKYESELLEVTRDTIINTKVK